jgi:hypothetical protein
MSKLHDTLNQQVREKCRACHNVCYVSADADGVAPPVAAEGYRCEGCEAAGYERYDFDKSLPRPDGEIIVQNSVPRDGAVLIDDTSEARPSDEPKSPDEPQGEQVEVSASPAEAE